jgi:antitoxin CptB
MLLSEKEKLTYWRCRRGMLELDLLLQPFFLSCYATLSAEQQSVFAELLEESDQDLFLWLRGGDMPADPALQSMIVLIRNFARHSV